ncbi:TonB-dependent receptor [soil metagenome]
MKRTLSVAVGFLLGAGALQAQQPPRPAGPGAPPPAPGEVRGTIVEAEGTAPVGGASIAVRSKRDSSLVTGAVAGQNGAFVIQGLRPGEYYLRITSIGFTPRSQDFAITPESPRASVGNVGLTRFAVTLQNVEVTTEAPAMVIEPDRNSYRAKDVAPAAANASEVLQATPSVEVDADGKVSLRGNENVAVQINGRPAPIRGEQLGAYLKQLPASVVERIEVVPTPSARHDPEGMAGIINVVLQQNVDLGRSGGFTIAASPSNRYNVSGRLGQQTGPWSLMSTYGFNADDRDIVGINDRERFDAVKAPLSYTEQDVDGNVNNYGHNFNTTVDFKRNDRDLFSNVLAMNRRNSNDQSVNAYTELSGDRSLIEQYVRPRNMETKGFMVDYTTAFRRTFEPRRHELSTELRFNRQDDDDRTILWRQAVAGDEGQSRTEMESRNTESLTNSLTAQLDYTRSYGERTKLETGYKGNAKWLNRDYTVLEDETGSGTWTPSDLSNAFELDEQVHAVYGVLSQGVGKWELQAGLRAEQATRDFMLASENFPYSYGSLFPSAVASYKPGEASQIKLAYSRRVRRPGTQELNPFPVFFDVHNVFIGNPRLNPEYTDALELSYNRSFKLGTFQVSPFYRRTTDVIRFIIDTEDVVEGREVTSVTFENLATGNSWGTDMNGSLRLGPKFSSFAGFNIFKMVTEGGTGSATALSSNAVTWSARVNATTTLREGLTLQGFYFYRAPMNVERGRFSKSQMASFTLRQQVSPKSSLALRVQDPFNTMGFRVEASDDNVLQITERKFDVRSVHLTYQYTFGQAPRIRQRPEAQPDQPVGFPGN